MAALKILGNDVVMGRKVHLAKPALEDPGPTQRLYEQPPHAYLNEFFYSDITESTLISKLIAQSKHKQNIFDPFPSEKMSKLVFVGA